MALIDPPLYVQSDAHPARSFRALITETWHEGVLRQTAFAVSERNAGDGGPNFSVDFSAGRAVIEGDADPWQGNYMATNDAVDNVAVTSAPTAGNHRYDLVVLEMKDDAEDAGGLNLARVRVVAGTPSSTGLGDPTEPAIPDSALVLARIGPITNGTTTITDSIITDRRVLAGRVDTPGTFAWAGGESVPSGWLLCDGSTKLIADYPDLAEEFGTRYGGNGTTTFGLPDGRGRVMVPAKSGQAQVDTIGETGGEYAHTITTAEMPSHNHPGSTVDPASVSTSTDGSHTHDTGDAGDTSSASTGGLSDIMFPASPGSATSSNGAHSHTVDIGNTAVTVAAQGSGTAMNVMQPYQVIGSLLVHA